MPDSGSLCETGHRETVTNQEQGRLFGVLHLEGENPLHTADGGIDGCLDIYPSPLPPPHDRSPDTSHISGMLWPKIGEKTGNTGKGHKEWPATQCKCRID